jgi:hypothetical protein
VADLGGKGTGMSLLFLAYACFWRHPRNVWAIAFLMFAMLS